MDSRTPALIAASLMLACCSPKKAENAPAAPPPEPAPAAAPAPAPATNATSAEAPAPAEAPDAPTPAGEVTPDVAAGIAREYFALIGAKQYPMALALWGSSAPTKDALAKQYDKYATFDATVGAPGQQQGAAGSSYIEIPVKASATLKSGGAEKLAGTVVLRRVNDVPGSTAAQRHWHIYSVELKPA
ncbi:MAG: hypothetical protein ACM3W4_00390 [Ignavibacteriales bacterium]